MCCRIGLLVFVLLQFVAVLAVVLGTPFDMFRPKNSGWKSNPPCLTLWGVKNVCYGPKYDIPPSQYWLECPERRKRFRIAEGAALVTIGLLGISFILAFIQCCCCVCCKFVSIILNLLGVASGIVVFALMADSWFNRRGPANIFVCGSLKDQDLYRFGAGFALFVAAVGVALVNVIFLLLPF